MAFCGLSLLLMLLLGVLYFEYKQDIKTILKDQDSQKNEINSIKKELKDFMLAKTHVEKIDETPHPIISYWGSIKAKGKQKHLLSSMEIDN